jgi:hypothetical protein
MGLIGLLLAPFRMPVWLLEAVRDEAEREYYDTEAIDRQMRDVEELIKRGELDEREGEQTLDALTGRLLEARQYHTATTAQDPQF